MFYNLYYTVHFGTKRREICQTCLNYIFMLMLMQRKVYFWLSISVLEANSYTSSSKFWMSKQYFRTKSLKLFNYLHHCHSTSVISNKTIRGEMYRSNQKASIIADKKKKLWGIDRENATSLKKKRVIFSHSITHMMIIPNYIHLTSPSKGTKAVSFLVTFGP